MIKAYGIDPVHFGSIMILNLCIGLLAPPGATAVVARATGKSFNGGGIAQHPHIPYRYADTVLTPVTSIPTLTVWLPELILV